MWLLFAFLSAIFAGLTSILAKCGIKNTNSTLATAIRTIVVLVFAWIMVFVVGSQGTITSIDGNSMLFLFLSGLATGLSWLCYFKALQLGSISKVVPIDKSSTMLTIVLAFMLLKETVSLPKIIGVIIMTIGTFCMLEKKTSDDSIKGKGYLIYALGSAFFASLTAILSKIGMSEVESTLGTALRTIVVLVMSWIMVFVSKKHTEIRNIKGKELFFIIISGFATGGSWLCYYKALKDGLASVVVPIDKLSILVAIVFSFFVFKEKLTKKALVGLILIVVGTLAMLIE